MGCYPSKSKQCKVDIINQFVCLKGCTLASYGNYGCPIQFKLPLECHNEVRRNYIKVRRLHISATRAGKQCLHCW